MGTRITPLKAIRIKCAVCRCGSTHAIRECVAESCPLHPFRMGKDPFRTRRKPTDGQRVAPKSSVASKTPVIYGEKSANQPSEGNYIPEIKTAEKAAESLGGEDSANGK